MNWLDRVLASLRRAIHDLISEEDLPEGATFSALLAAARVRIDALHIELDEATAREQRAEMELTVAQARLDTLNTSMDAALRTGQDVLAREHLEQAQAEQRKVDQLTERRRDYAQVAAKLRTEVRALQAQLDDTRRQVDQLADRERNAQAVEQLSQLRRDLRKFVATTRNDLGEREEQIARREDRLAAREEVERTSYR
ncbi:MAG TPA: PspA/IM30 family protein [Anaerolineae bacterium]|nr:PspA/IM30 family protein [Anaerolineae bacterium]